MKKLVGSVLLLVLAVGAVAVPLTFAEETSVLKVKVYCVWKNGGGEEVTIVQIPEKEAVMQKCIDYGGTVLIYEVKDPA